MQLVTAVHRDGTQMLANSMGYELLFARLSTSSFLFCPLGWLDVKPPKNLAGKDKLEGRFLFPAHKY